MLPWESPSHKMQAVLSHQKDGGEGVIVPGVPSVDRGNWEREHDIFLSICQILDQPVPGHHVSSSARKKGINEKKTKQMAGSLPF